MCRKTMTCYCNADLFGAGGRTTSRHRQTTRCAPADSRREPHAGHAAAQELIPRLSGSNAGACRAPNQIHPKEENQMDNSNSNAAEEHDSQDCIKNLGFVPTTNGRYDYIQARQVDPTGDLRRHSYVDCCQYNLRRSTPQAQTPVRNAAAVPTPTRNSRKRQHQRPN